jgi:hypothetical protein
MLALTPRPLEQLSDWLHPFERIWRERLRALADLMEDEETP